MPEGPNGPEEDSAPRSPSKGLRGVALAFAVASAAFLVAGRRIGVLRISKISPDPPEVRSRSLRFGL